LEKSSIRGSKPAKALCGTKQKGRKSLFFEKKKQRTFALALSSLDANRAYLARNQTGKSFWFFFQKKNTHFLTPQQASVVRRPAGGIP
jgi:hypothetical protein